MATYLSALILYALVCSQFMVSGSASSSFRRFQQFLGRGVPERSGEGSNGNYKELYFTQKLDHFNVGDTRTFQERYLVNDDYWNQNAPNPGPILLYTGNEGDITLFYDNTGFLFDVAKQLNGLVLFIEHRYYGKSLPFGVDSYRDTEHLSYLTSEQALADFALVVTDLKKTSFKTERYVPVIAFGGSYGGMLAAWMRMKYPHIVAGSIAGSAPLWWFSDLTPCNSASVTVTKDFEESTPESPGVCSSAIRKSWSAIDRMAVMPGGLSWLSSAFSLCHSMASLSSVKELKGWLATTWFNLAMADYPIPANFLAPMPAWPIKATCQHLSTPSKSDEELLTAVGESLGVYYNYTGNSTCYSLNSSDTNSLGDAGWNFQACTEMVMPMCSDGVTDMFELLPWDYEEYKKGCLVRYQVPPQPSLVQLMYGGKNISSHSNIVFSNGLLDPWHGGGVLKDISDSLVAVIIPDGAHHYDLRGAQDGDTASVIVARQTELKYIQKWIEEYDVL